MPPNKKKKKDGGKKKNQNPKSHRAAAARAKKEAGEEESGRGEEAEEGEAVGVVTDPGRRRRGDRDRDHHHHHEDDEDEDASDYDSSYEPARGSWVAELEEAEEALSLWLDRDDAARNLKKKKKKKKKEKNDDDDDDDGNDDEDDSDDEDAKNESENENDDDGNDEDDDQDAKNENDGGDDDVDNEAEHLRAGLEAHARACRAYQKLRRWGKLRMRARSVAALAFGHGESSKTSSPSLSSPSPSSTLPSSPLSFASTFRSYGTRAQRELRSTRDSYLNLPGGVQRYRIDRDGNPVAQDDVTAERARQQQLRRIGGREMPGPRLFDDVDDDDDHDDDIDDDDHDGDEGSPNNIDGRTAPTTIQTICRRHAIAGGIVPDTFDSDGGAFGNANLLQEAVLGGDMKLLEEMVRLGCAIDRTFKEVPDDVRLQATQLMVPTTATALVAACVLLAVADNRWFAQFQPGLPRQHRNPEVLEGMAQCAIQLVNLGADVERPYVLLRGYLPLVFCAFNLDNKTAFEIAQMTNRPRLVAAMVEHRNVSPEVRAETLVHCRCGSRLPWRRCHATGIGQPPHYITKSDSGRSRIHYRVSPMARCPCGMVPTTYYRCCWRDNGKPTYMDDRTGFHFGTYINAAPAARERINACTDRSDPDHAEFLAAYDRGKQEFRESVHQIANSEAYFRELCRQWGPKSKISSWNRFVYAGCLANLNEAFYWTDVHWDVDKPELERRANEWNFALERFCDKMRLVGEGRASIIARHTANPCAPCGCVGCDAMEKEVRQFQRCSRCKKIAYCGRECQKKDWRAGHKNTCQPPLVFEDGPASRK